MKLLLLATALFGSLTSENSILSLSELNLPHGLELGKTLRTDLDPGFVSNGEYVSYFADGYDAHFNGHGFLETIALDKGKGHVIPEKWGINWDVTVEEIEDAFSAHVEIKKVNRDVSKSLFVTDLVDVSFTYENRDYHFYMIDWKESSKIQNGLSRVVITSAQTID